MSRPNIHVAGRTSSQPSGARLDLSGILNDAMKAVSDAQTAVSQIQNITHFEAAPPYVPPDAPIIDPMTGQPKFSSGQSATPQKRKVMTEGKTAIQMVDGTLINIVNSQNIQVGDRNTMYVSQRNEAQEDSESDVESDPEDLQEVVRRRRRADEETAEILRDSHRPVSDAELQRLSRHVGGPWRRLIRLLNIDDAEVDFIFHTHQSGGLEEVVYTLLKKWKQENNNPTVGDLIRALERAQLTRLLRHLKP